MNNRISNARTIFFGGLLFGPWFAAPAFAACDPLYPNLRPLPASDISLVLSVGLPFELRFGATNWNSGDGRLELIGTGNIITDPNDPTQQKQQVNQRIYDTCGGYDDVSAGWFRYHPAHNHFHFDNFARYNLRPAGAPETQGRNGSKTTFCVMDTTSINPQLWGATGQFYTTCGITTQGMSVGWGDTYGSQLAGQSIDLTQSQGQGTFTAGNYWLELNVDPGNDNSTGQILETHDDDNWSCVLLTFYGDPVASFNITGRHSGRCNNTVVLPRIDSISPSQVLPGSTVDVTIRGLGFDPAMSVSFSNGSSIPTVNNARYIDSTTIEATIKVTGKRKLKDAVLDLNVGSPFSSTGYATKLNALTIITQ